MSHEIAHMDCERELLAAQQEIKQLRAERDEAKRLQETERQRADAYSFRLDKLDAELAETRAQLKALQGTLPAMGASNPQCAFCHHIVHVPASSAWPINCPKCGGNTWRWPPNQELFA